MKKETTEIWDEYDETGIGVGTYTDRALFDQYNRGRVLDLGCGRGAFLANLPNAEKFGVDASSRAIATAQASHLSINFQVADVTRLPFADDFFDLVYSLDVIEHVKDYDQMLREVRRILKPGGFLFIQTPNYPIKRWYDLVYWFRGRRPFADDYTHVSRFSFWSLSRSVGKQLTIIKIRPRNILLGSRLAFLEKFRIKATWPALVLGQKTIVIAQKP